MIDATRTEAPWTGRNILLYDGECPFCSRAADFYRMREALPNLELISMRDHRAVQALNLPQRRTAPEDHSHTHSHLSEPSKGAALSSTGIRLEEGMVLLLADGSFLQGADAFQKISAVLEPNGLLAKLHHSVGRGSVLSRLLYPLLKLGRRISLFVLGRSANIRG